MNYLLYFVVLVCCRALTPATPSKSRMRTNSQISPFNLKPNVPATIITANLSKKNVVEGVNLINSEHLVRPSFWKSKAPKSLWKERILIEELKVGQELSGHVVQQHLEGKTGPKLYFECGVGRTNRNGDWEIVNAMLRLDHGKASVARKYAARYRKKTVVQLFVCRVQKECGRLEVCTDIDKVKKYAAGAKTSITALKKNQEVIGRVVKLYPYGAIIDIGANVLGLLHITKVAFVMNQYIDKERGLKNAGLEKGAKVRLMVESIEKRKLSLDFTDDVKESAREEKFGQKEAPYEQRQVDDEYIYSQDRDHMEAKTAYTNQRAQIDNRDDKEVRSRSIENDDSSYDYDVYDEEMDIESSLGLDMY